jgi:hypothetical protein
MWNDYSSDSIVSRVLDPFGVQTIKEEVVNDELADEEDADLLDGFEWPLQIEQTESNGETPSDPFASLNDYDVERPTRLTTRNKRSGIHQVKHEVHPDPEKSDGGSQDEDYMSAGLGNESETELGNNSDNDSFCVSENDTSNDSEDELLEDKPVKKYRKYPGKTRTNLNQKRKPVRVKRVGVPNRRQVSGPIKCLSLGCESTFNSESGRIIHSRKVHKGIYS